LPDSVTGVAMLSWLAFACSRPTSSGSGEIRHWMVPGITTPASESTARPRRLPRSPSVAMSTSTTRPLPLQIDPAASASRTRPSVARARPQSIRVAGAVASTVASVTSTPSSAYRRMRPGPQTRSPPRGLRPLAATPGHLEREAAADHAGRLARDGEIHHAHAGFANRRIQPVEPPFEIGLAEPDLHHLAVELELRDRARQPGIGERFLDPGAQLARALDALARR